MKTDNTKQPGDQTAPIEVTPEMIAKWKEKYGDVFCFTAADGKQCYLRRPSRTVLSLATVGAQTDPLKFNEVILENCFLGGDPCFKTDDDYFMGVSKNIADIVPGVEGELKKL